VCPGLPRHGEGELESLEALVRVGFELDRPLELLAEGGCEFPDLTFLYGGEAVDRAALADGAHTGAQLHRHLVIQTLHDSPEIRPMARPFAKMREHSGCDVRNDPVVPNARPS
jgi:hypothetical protein